ncbi:MAG: branched-chain amino acid ABC transporter substrate-binding protein [Betaproteobacteria bacterium]
MLTRPSCPAAWLLAGLMAALPQVLWAADWRLSLIEREDPPSLSRTRQERAYLGHPGGPARDGVALALEDAKLELDAGRTKISLSHELARDAATAVAQAQRAEKAGAKVLLLNLPAGWLTSVAAAVKLPVLNLGAGDDALRERDCRAHVFHVAPSERMRADALAQTLLTRKWSQVLLLAGASEADAARAATAKASLIRHGLKIVQERRFVLSADPRERAQSNPALLTGGNSYDAVWVVDSDGEFARALPYNTVLPRPVVGDAGLTAQAWQAQFERFGAPQVSRRFSRAYKRAMTSSDWNAWMGGKVAAAAALAQPQPTTLSAWSSWLHGQDFDGAKGVVMQFRAWDGQLRQPLLLTDGQGVQAMAPVEGILHPRNALDALGADAPEQLCKGRS